MDENIGFAVPQTLHIDNNILKTQRISLRVKKPLGKAVIQVFYGDLEVGKETASEAVPAEMIHVPVN